MGVDIRRGRLADAPLLGDICYRAFREIALAHGFIPDFPSVEAAVAMAAGMIANDAVFDVVVEAGGAPVGSNFVQEGPIAGIGPITVDPALQDKGLGAALMKAVMDRSIERGSIGVRLVQSAYHSRSLALYLRLGFDVREQLACLQGPPIRRRIEGYAVRAATPADLPVCNRLCLRVHGHERGGEAAEAVSRGTARVVEREGRITGFATLAGFFGHGVGETTQDLEALIAAAEAFAGPGLLIPTRNGELMRWCLANGLRIAQTLTLMSAGFYEEPQAAWWPSVIY